jgi:hypothetical protein
MSDVIRQAADLESREPRRLPLGVGLMVGATASLCLWSVIALGVRAIVG